MSDSQASPRIIRKKTGNFLEDFQPGQVFRHKGGKTVTEGLFTTFTEFAMTTNPLAKNARYARAYGFEGLVCPPGLVMLVAFSQTVEDVSENARANLEYIDMRFGAPGLRRRHDRGRDQGARRAHVVLSRPNLGIVHVQSTARKNLGDADEAIVATWQRKVQVYKHDDSMRGRRGRGRARTRSTASSGSRPTTPKREATRRSRTSRAATATSRTSSPARGSSTRAGRTMTSEHIAPDRDPRQHEPGPLQPAHDRPRPQAVRRRPADRLRRHPVHALPRPLLPRRRRQRPRRRRLHDGPPHRAALRRRHGLRRHRDPRPKRDHPARPDLGVVSTRLFGHKFVRAEGEQNADAPPGWKKVPIFELDRELAVKRRSHYV